MTVLEDVLNDAAGFAGATRVDLWAPGLRDNSAGTGGVTPQVYSATVGEGGALLTEDIDPGHYKYRVAFNRFIPSQEGELVVPDSVTPVRFVPLATEFVSYSPPVVSDAVAAKVAAEAAADRAEAVEAVQNTAIAGVVTTGATKTALDATYATPAAVTTQLADEVPPMVAEAIADESTVIAAAASAVSADIEGRNLVERTDPGAPNVIDAANVLVSIADSAGRQTFLTAVDTDGGPSEHSADLIASRMTGARLNLGIEKKEVVEGLLGGLVDTNGRYTWLTARDTDGGPTDHAVSMLLPRIGLGAGGIQLSQLSSAIVDLLNSTAISVYIPEITGTTPSRSLYVNNTATGARTLVTSSGDPRNPTYVTNGILFDTDTGPKVFDTTTLTVKKALPESGYVVGVGDSLTAAGTWLSRVASLLSVTTANLGVAGQTTTEIAIRQGGTAPLLTVTGNQIPASGPVEVTAISPTSKYRDAGGETTVPFTFDGTLAGVPGTLTQNSQLTPMTRTFTRTTDGSAVACPAGTPFYASQGTPHRERVQVIWAGRNNISDPAIVTRDVAAMVANLATYQKRYLVCSVTNGQNEPSGSAGYNSIAAINSALSAAYGSRYVDVRRYLIDHGLADAGITPTAGDTTAISEDRIPPSLHIDTIHFTTAGYNAVGNCIAAAITSKGWN